MRGENTTAYQDREITSAENFGDDISKFADQVSEHISNLVTIISELDEKLEKAKKLLDDNEISHGL